MLSSFKSHTQYFCFLTYEVLPNPFVLIYKVLPNQFYGVAKKPFILVIIPIESANTLLKEFILRPVCEGLTSRRTETFAYCLRLNGSTRLLQMFAPPKKFNLLTYKSPINIILMLPSLRHFDGPKTKTCSYPISLKAAENALKIYHGT